MIKGHSVAQSKPPELKDTFPDPPPYQEGKVKSTSAGINPFREHKKEASPSFLGRQGKTYLEEAIKAHHLESYAVHILSTLGPISTMVVNPNIANTLVKTYKNGMTQAQSDFGKVSTEQLSNRLASLDSWATSQASMVESLPSLGKLCSDIYAVVQDTQKEQKTGPVANVNNNALALMAGLGYSLARSQAGSKHSIFKRDGEYRFARIMYDKASKSIKDNPLLSTKEHKDRIESSREFKSGFPKEFGFP